METIKGIIESSYFGRQIFCISVGRNLSCEIRHPLELVTLSIFPLGEEQYIVQDGGQLGRAIPDLDRRLPQGWHYRNGEMFRVFEVWQSANVVRDVVQLLEEAALCSVVLPSLIRGDLVHPA